MEHKSNCVAFSVGENDLIQLKIVEGVVGHVEPVLVAEFEMPENKKQLESLEVIGHSDAISPHEIFQMICFGVGAVASMALQKAAESGEFSDEKLDVKKFITDHQNFVPFSHFKRVDETVH